MDLSERPPIDATRPAAAWQPSAQLRYAHVLDWGTRLGFIALAVSFVAYLGGGFEPHVPLEQLPSLWNQSVASYLKLTGTPAGWGWLALAHKSDIANLVGVVLLAGASLPPLLAVLLLYLRQRDWVHAVICALEVGVIVLAASGVLTAGH